MPSTLSRKPIIEWAREHIDGVAILRPIFHPTVPHLFAQAIAHWRTQKTSRVSRQKKEHTHTRTKSPKGLACMCVCVYFTHILVDKEGAIKQWTCEQFGGWWLGVRYMQCLLVSIHTRQLDTTTTDIPQRQTQVIKKMRSGSEVPYARMREASANWTG